MVRCNVRKKGRTISHDTSNGSRENHNCVDITTVIQHINFTKTWPEPSDRSLTIFLSMSIIFRQHAADFQNTSPISLKLPFFLCPVGFALSFHLGTRSRGGHGPIM